MNLFLVVYYILVAFCCVITGAICMNLLYQAYLHMEVPVHNWFTTWIVNDHTTAAFAIIGAVSFAAANLYKRTVS